MRKLIGLVALLAACSQSPAPAPAPRPGPAAPSNMTGAADARGAVVAYLAAAKAEDLQAMSVVWGTREGPARSIMERDYLEKAEIINIRCIGHDSYEILSDAPSASGSRAFAVLLKRRDLTRTTNFYAVPGPSGRWYLERFEPEPLKEFCGRR